MPIYTYRREDGSTFDIRQKFTDDALTVDPETGQNVVRVVQAANIVFKGSGFYVTDNKSARSSTATSSDNGNGSSKEASTSSSNGSSNGASSSDTSAKSEKAPAKSESAAS
ncbi:MAG: FmdB family transcriptional regulator [Anaerolineae bacterium]|nr:FmdB family transcriptional regulator [Anaerolineae bacterium]MCA9890647.1 FmdB family transcriptional regulator [Anaerolineae bacterium]MCA9892161.1 FmdB family transcriptional regulator [Anaerolineae bacterium]